MFTDGLLNDVRFTDDRFSWHNGLSKDVGFTNAVVFPDIVFEFDMKDALSYQSHMLILMHDMTLLKDEGFTNDRFSSHGILLKHDGFTDDGFSSHDRLFNGVGFTYAVIFLDIEFVMKDAL